MKSINDKGIKTGLLQSPGEGYQILKSIRNILGKQAAKTNRFRWKKDPGYEPTRLCQGGTLFLKGDLIPFNVCVGGEISVMCIEKDVSVSIFSKSDSVNGFLMTRRDTAGETFTLTDPPVAVNVHISQMLRFNSAEVSLLDYKRVAPLDSGGSEVFCD